MTYRNGYQYKCVITDAFGNTSETREATLTVVNSSVEIVTQPENADVGVGENAVFTVALNNAEDVTYQWYYSNAEGKWAKTTTADSNTDTLTVVAKAYRDGYQYKCVITDAYGNVIESDVVTLTVTPAQ